MKHVTMIVAGYPGTLGVCDTCGARNKEFTTAFKSQAWCDEHERRAEQGRLDLKTRPSLTVLERTYRDNALNEVYTEPQRLLWLQLADELAERNKPRRYEMEGQMELFPEEETP